MLEALHIFVTCTKRKHLVPEPTLLMRSIRAVSPIARAHAWIRRVAKTGQRKLPAFELYAGDHWQISKQLPIEAARNGFAPRLWVISAGYGLIEASTPVCAYSAAFSPGHQDCVTQAGNLSETVSGFRQWWRTISQWSGPDPGKPRTLTQLIRRETRGRFIVVASELYLQAIWSDIQKAHRFLGDRSAERLLVISAGTSNFGELLDCTLPIDARLQIKLKGARRTLNVRAARSILSCLRPEQHFSEVRRKYSKLLTTAPPLETIYRLRATDAEVMGFLQNKLAQNPKASATRLLQQFRDKGRACEQKRFGHLHNRVSEKYRA